MLFTPVINWDLTYKGKTEFSPDSTAKFEGVDKVKGVHEKIQSNPIEQSISSSAPQGKFFQAQSKFHDYLECLLDTDIKPEYQDQFKIIKQ